MALTEKQEKFCRAIVSGMTNKDAYMSAYNCQSENAAWIESTKLLNREDIQAKIKTLRKPIELKVQTEAINARQKQIEAIQERIELCKQKDDEQSLIRYYDMLNKIYALYKDNEQDNNKPESTVNNLDISVLKRLSGVS
jgi:phage terminase small subunit